MWLIRKFKLWKLKRKLRRALPIFIAFDGMMKRAGIKRGPRRFFWRSMACEEDRQKAIDYISKEISESKNFTNKMVKEVIEEGE